MEDMILEVIEEYNNLDDYIERENLLQREIDDKSEEDIRLFLDNTIKKLIDTPVSERGGLIAITGFYYQMLVAIDYLIQMKQGQWDNVAIELHDDIVVNKGKHIRFIQVKTSNKLICKATESPASSMYLRSTKKIKESDDEICIKISTSWIDKLILKSKDFKIQEGYFTEFELLTNYIISNGDKIKLDNYIGNNNSKIISNNDSLYKELIKDSYVIDERSKQFVKVEYEEMCGEKLEELMPRFHINSKPNSLDNINQYLDSICQRIATEIGGVFVSHEDVNGIIGKLFARCNVNAENRSLVITKNEVESLFLEMQTRAMVAAENLVEENGTINIVESVYKSIHIQYGKMKHYKKIEEKMLKYKEYLISWINDNGGINKIINRYISANEISNNYVGMEVRDKEDIIQELIIMPIVLMILHSDEVFYADNKNFLTKEIICSENKKMSLLRVDKGKIKNKINDIKSIINNLETEDILKITMAKDLNIILQGYSDRKFDVREKIEIDTCDDEIKFLDDKGSIKKVNQVVSLIPGEIMKACLEEQLDEGVWNEEELRELWEEITEGEI